MIYLMLFYFIASRRRAGQSSAAVYTSEFLIAKLNASAPSAARRDRWLRGAHMIISFPPPIYTVLSIFKASVFISSF